MAYRTHRTVGSRVPDGATMPVWRHVVALLVLVAYLAGAVSAGHALWARWQLVRFEQRGVTYGSASTSTWSGTDARAINVALEQYPDDETLAANLDQIAGAGFRWVRQRFPWDQIEPQRGNYQWARWDAIVEQCQAHGLHLIAVLDGSPAWARPPEDAANPYAPPRNPGDFATFARQFALRYRESIDYYQVWDEPNIYPHWGERDPSPEGYVALLRAARTQIRDVDPGSVLVSAGLAPTTESEGRNLSELLFLGGIYDAGGGGLFDVVAAKPYGFWSGPDDRVVDPGRLNFSRLVLLHEEMVRRGDGAKPVWAVSWGWNALPAGWEGDPSPWGNDVAWRQYGRDEQAIERARREWPWLELMCYASWQPVAAPSDPVWGLSLLSAEGETSPLYYRFVRLNSESATLYPGHYMVPLDSSDSASPAQVTFWGTRLDLVGPGRWQMLAVDGRSDGRTLHSDGGVVPVVRGLAAGEHTVTLAPAEPAQALQFIVSQGAPPWLPPVEAALLAAGTLLATGALWYGLRSYAWFRWFRQALAWYTGLSAWTALALAGGLLAALAFSPNLALSLLALAALGLAALARPEAGLLLAVFLVPLAPLQKQLGPAQFSYLEIVTLLTVAGQLAREALASASRWRSGWRPALPALWSAVRGANALDLGMGLLVAISFASLGVSANLHVSLRELRVVVLQAGFVYWLIVHRRVDRPGILRLADVLVLSTVLVSLQGLYQFAATDRVIIAEGVRRARGIYGSPNNLALVLGRVWPVMLAMFLGARRGVRRWLYGLAALPVGLCFFVTFSRGAWFVGVPAALLALALLVGNRRSRVVIAGVAVLGVAGLLPLFRTARFSSLLSLQGTSLFRLKLWEAAWDMVRDHPLFGVGLDNFLYYYPRYIRPEAMSEPNLSHPHNVVLDFWLRLGIPGLLVFGWLEWRFFRSAFKLWRRRADPELWALAVGVTAGMVYMLAHGLVDSSFFVVELAGIFALMLAIVRRLEVLTEDAEEPSQAR